MTPATTKAPQSSIGNEPRNVSSLFVIPAKERVRELSRSTPRRSSCHSHASRNPGISVAHLLFWPGVGSGPPLSRRFRGATTWGVGGIFYTRSKTGIHMWTAPLSQGHGSSNAPGRPSRAPAPAGPHGSPGAAAARPPVWVPPLSRGQALGHGDTELRRMAADRVEPHAALLDQ
jgi:hypothetical protein